MDKQAVPFKLIERKVPKSIVQAFLKWAESDDYMIYSDDEDDSDLLEDMWSAFRAGMRYQRKRAKKAVAKGAA